MTSVTHACTVAWTTIKTRISSLRRVFAKIWSRWATRIFRAPSLSALKSSKKCFSKTGFWKKLLRKVTFQGAQGRKRDFRVPRGRLRIQPAPRGTSPRPARDQNGTLQNCACMRLFSYCSFRVCACAHLQTASPVLVIGSRSRVGPHVLCLRDAYKNPPCSGPCRSRPHTPRCGRACVLRALSTNLLRLWSAVDWRCRLLATKRLSFPYACALCAVRGIARSHKKLGEFKLCDRTGIQRYLHARDFTSAFPFARGFGA